mgnify:CR=1 FL=1
MNENVVSQRQLSAKSLALIPSFVACTLCAVVSVVIVWIVPFPSDVRVFGTILAVVCSYMQLMASTIYRSPVQRNGGDIEAMMYSDLGDNDVHLTVRQWVCSSFISVLCWSAFTSALCVCALYMVGNQRNLQSFCEPSDVHRRAFSFKINLI